MKKSILLIVLTLFSITGLASELSLKTQARVNDLEPNTQSKRQTSALNDENFKPPFFKNGGGISSTDKTHSKRLDRIGKLKSADELQTIQTKKAEAKTDKGLQLIRTY